MTCILYKISNSVNNKVYIGKTADTPEERWRQHKRDYKVHTTRPLYRAMGELGFDKFSIEVIGVYPTDQIDEAEIRAIESYASYIKGYNATLGGEGATKIDRQQVLALYDKISNCAEVSRQLRIDHKSVARIVRASGRVLNTAQNGASKSIYINDVLFSSYKEAAEFLIASGVTRSKEIDTVSKGLRRALANKKPYFGMKIT